MNETIDVVNQVNQNAPVAPVNDGMWGMILYCVVIMAILYLFMMSSALISAW